MLLDALLCIIQGGPKGRKGRSQEARNSILKRAREPVPITPLPYPPITINWARAREQRGVRLVKTIYEKPSFRDSSRVSTARPIIEIDG